MTIGNPHNLIFVDRNGHKIRSISNAFDRAVKNLGFNDGVSDRRFRVTFHTLRHTYASWLVQKGVDLYTVKKLMGHSTLAMTERYSHLAQDNLRDAVKKLEGSLTKKTEPTVIQTALNSVS